MTPYRHRDNRYNNRNHTLEKLKFENISSSGSTKRLKKEKKRNFSEFHVNDMLKQLYSNTTPIKLFLLNFL